MDQDRRDRQIQTPAEARSQPRQSHRPRSDPQLHRWLTNPQNRERKDRRDDRDHQIQTPGEARSRPRRSRHPRSDPQLHRWLTNPQTQEQRDRRQERDHRDDLRKDDLRIA